MTGLPLNVMYLLKTDASDGIEYEVLDGAATIRLIARSIIGQMVK